MWVYRLGAERAKRMLFTGDLVSGREAKELGLVIDAVSSECLDDRVNTLAERMAWGRMRMSPVDNTLAERLAGVPRNQLMMQKLMINQAMDAMGLANTQMIATVFDGITRHTPEGMWFKRYAEEHGFRAATEWRDSGRPIPEGDEARRS